ncbi:MAG TPA: hypothetical protein VKA85_01955, partial [Candidatus Limnocylindrales bacterium]|nr:hypothetical protein [Candidatus Limnocylindrales bacterium]
FRVDPGTGVTREIELTGGNVSSGDGLLLQGKRLFVVQNQLNRIAVIRIDRRLTHGTIKRLLTDPLFDVPTTIDDVGHETLYAVNARFTTPPTPATTYNIVRVDVRSSHGKGKDDDHRGPKRGPG